MSEANHQIARDFVAALSGGALPDALLAPDFTVWTTTTPGIDGATYQGGIVLLATVFSEKPIYSIDSLTAEDDRVIVEAQARGVLVNGEPYHNCYVFVLRIRDGRIAALAEHFDPRIIQDKIMPLLHAAMAKAPAVQS
jgi:ketosteroid isomerase-like protein